ncbi:MAG: deoxyribose-phosphate aldolase [Candidatus Neomarinimicrobiota bacterium]
MKLSKYIDHTLLKPQATEAELKKLCEEAIQYDFAAVCVNPCNVAYCASILESTKIKLASVVGFPLGASIPSIKSAETLMAVEDGANEIDMVINIGALKDKKYELVEADIKAVVDSAEFNTVKVIIETCLLSDEEKVKACELARSAGAHFVKTSTGFSTGGATVEDVELMYKTVGKELKVKASGGVRTYEDAQALIDAGASRIGASSGLAILEGNKS